MYSKAFIVAAALVGCHHVTPVSAFRSMTTAEPERGTCSSPPEPVCFDDAHNQDEAACVTGEGCMWQVYEVGSGTTDAEGGGGNCIVEECWNQESSVDCAAFGEDGACSWNAEEERCNADNNADAGGPGSGSGSGSGPTDIGNGGNEESVCFGEDLREDEAACNANTACVWETFEMGSGQEESGSCSELSCYNQATVEACAAWTAASDDECTWNADDEFCSGADDGDYETGSGSGSGSGGSGGPDFEESVCNGEDLSDDENACNANTACFWETYDMGSGQDFGMCSTRSCYSQDSAQACAAWTAASDDECTWNADDEFCSGGGFDGDDESSGTGPGGGGGDIVESACYGEDLRENANACTADPACLWETFEMGEGQEAQGMCTELSCYNQESVEACAAWSESSDDECSWEAEYEYCNDSGGGSGIGEDDDGANEESVCYGDELREDEDGCNANDACMWETFDMGEGQTSGMCSERSCYTQNSAEACAAWTAASDDECSWNADDEFCDTEQGGTDGSDPSSGDGPNTGEESECYGDDLREDEDACNANAACVWETFEMGSGQDSGMCSERSCYSQDSGEACAAWSAASDDECTWNAEDEFCQGNDGDMDTGSGSGSMDETDGSDHCAAFNDSRNECERSGCDFEAAATTTMPPTNTPTNPPTSPPVSPPTNSDGTCSRNCGTEARGGGTCRLNGRCTSCNENRVIQGGRCYASIACKGRRIQSGSQTGSNCRCVDDNCHYCNRAPEGDVCRVCTLGTYLLDGACVASCPTGQAMLGIGNFKRRCMAPFECQNGRLVGIEAAYGCKCANDDMTPSACQFCSFRANEFGQHCTRCLGGKYLRADNRCHDSCDGTGLIAYNPGNYGRECRAAFTCTDRTDPDGNACKCARSVGRNDCASCDYGSGGATCSRCTNSMYLEGGACVEACVSGSPQGDGTDGRECN